MNYGTKLLELSRMGMYVTYPYIESHENRELVPSRLLPKTGNNYLVTYSYKDGFLRYLR
jgi:hypothetical protein